MEYVFIILKLTFPDGDSTTAVMQTVYKKEQCAAAASFEKKQMADKLSRLKDSKFDLLTATCATLNEGGVERLFISLHETIKASGK